MPIYRDVNTPDPFIEPFEEEEAKAASRSDMVYMDTPGFGMGCCCLQVTFQATNLEEARTLYDQLAPLCPVVMALSAATPIHRGYLVDHDVRWSVISQSTDDRTKEELGEEPLRFNKYRINKSRYDSIDSYISDDGGKYNDIFITLNTDYYNERVGAGVEPLIAQHIAHLFIRDSIALYREKLEQDNTTSADHFENIQSSNWQTMRFKLPPPGSPEIGWRVEFRPMDVQITDFENAAYVVFIVLLTRVILTYRLNMLIPISKVDENMKEAMKRDALKRCKFWFRKDIIRQTSPPEASVCVEAASAECMKNSDTCCQNDYVVDESCILLTTNEIINGKRDQFPGLVPLLRQYLLNIEIDAETHCTVNQYLSLIANRASGKYITAAQWIRKFVANHKDYKHDSIVNDKINYDLIRTIDKITKGDPETIAACEDLLGDNPFIKKHILSEKSGSSK